NGKQGVLADSPLQMHILDAAVRLIAWQPVLFLVLRPITVGDNSAHSELDPILVSFGLLFRGRSDVLLIARTTANSSSGKSPRKDQHQESARGVRHNIQINI